MKRRSLILVGFLVVLFMIPMSFGNVSAIAYDYSPESIEEFNETLPSDVLFYPDAIEPQITEGNVSGAETNDYTATYVNDATYWQNQATGPDLYTYFDINGSFPVDTMHLEIDAIASGPIASHTLNLYLYNPQGTDLLVASKSEAGAGVDAALNGWYNVTAWGLYEYNSMHTFYLFTTGSVNPTNILVDYFRLSFMTGASQANPVLSDPYFATGGDTGFGNTYAVDASNFTVDGVLEFSYTAYNISSLVSFTYAIYGISAGSTFVHYSSDDIDYGTGPFDVITSEGWYNGTYNTALGALENTGIGYVWFATNSDSSINYMEISFTYIPVSGYGESFSDVSDWINTGLEGGDTFTSDGDIGEIDTDSTAGSDYTYSNVPSISAGVNYAEISYRLTGTATYVRLYYWTVDSKGGSSSFDVLSMSGDWETGKFLVETDVECVELVIYKAGATDMDLELDSFRIGPSNEMGFQYDGSTTYGVTTSANCEVATNGDLLNISTVGGSGNNQIKLDGTDTESTQSLSYYPFVEYSVTGVIDAGSAGAWKLRIYDDDSDYFESSSYINSTGVFRANIAAAADMDNIRFLRFYLQDSGDSITLDYIKFYSIADWTIGQGNMETDDVCFVNGTSLVTTGDGGSEYFAFDYDPNLSVAQTTYPFLNLTISDWTDPDANDDQFWYQYYVGGWIGQEWDETSDDLPTGTTTDFRTYIYVSLTLSEINFYGVVPAWNVITTVEIVFWVAGWQIISSIVIVFATEISTYTINLLLLFLGLAMIPTSTILLVKGGREEMSTDKLLVVILCFFMGWALFLGGIFA